MRITKEIAMPLVQWYQGNKRDLPWRHTADPYKIWVSEIMLQQTRVEAVRGYYDRFLSVLPDVASLAACEEDRLLKLWEGLGYYNRVRNMQKAARQIQQEEQGRFPENAAEIQKLPGIGSYTAGAVASIAFGERVPAVDGNVLRVYARLLALEDNILLPRVKKEAEEAFREVMKDLQEPEIYAGDFNQALIELGALVCVPDRAPHCDSCPLQPYCAAYKEEKTGVLPVRIGKQKRRVEKRTVLVVRTGTEALIRKRPPKGLLASLYEFPNMEGHVNDAEAVAYVEENGYDALRIQRLPEAKHVFSHVEWQMIGYEIRIAPPDEDRGAWICADLKEIEKTYSIPSAFSAYTDKLLIRKEESS
ncbi:MAG: A/G-specific adenine glycosylase [Lachnospiraceae bacterium]|nr:A/G-specific adenine glycosylase [Lachnospiraceae bacterium]